MNIGEVEEAFAKAHKIFASIDDQQDTLRIQSFFELAGIPAALVEALLVGSRDQLIYCVFSDTDSQAAFSGRYDYSRVQCERILESNTS